MTFSTITCDRNAGFPVHTDGRLYCEGDGECGTNSNLNNCGGSLGYDVYEVITELVPTASWANANDHASVFLGDAMSDNGDGGHYVMARRGSGSATDPDSLRIHTAFNEMHLLVKGQTPQVKIKEQLVTMTKPVLLEGAVGCHIVRARRSLATGVKREHISVERLGSAKTGVRVCRSRVP